MKILLIHAGGTIGMEKTEDGFAPKKGVVEAAVKDLLRKSTTYADVTIKALDPLIDSAQATPADWNAIAADIHQNYQAYDAFVVTHGTDTLAYSAAALCLALPGLDKPVVVTGAMLPLTVEGSDGWQNLEDALKAAETADPGVWVQFAGRLLHGAKARKSHTSDLRAFEAGISCLPPRITDTQFGYRSVSDKKIGVYPVMPGQCTEILKYIVDTCDGVLLKCYGSGTAPNTEGMREGLGHAQELGKPVLAVSQSPEGGIKLGTYAAGKVLREHGVIDGRDITTEMAYVKLHFGLSLFSDYAGKRDFLAARQCGEFSAVK